MLLHVCSITIIFYFGFKDLTYTISLEEGLSILMPIKNQQSFQMLDSRSKSHAETVAERLAAAILVFLLFTL